MTKAFNSPYKVINTRRYNTWCNYKTRIDTYGHGCSHDCSYCYAKALLNFRHFWDSENPAVSYITVIEKAISELSKNTVVRLGSMTDCFQPIEQEKKVTLQTIKLLNKYKINYLIVTKGTMVSKKEYLDIYDPDLSHFQVSISCTNDNKSSVYEKADTTTNRIKSIETLSRLGFDVSVRLSPFIYQYTDFNVLNNIKCRKILIEFLKVNHWIKKTLNIDYTPYSLKYGGHKNLQLSEKIKLVNEITGFEQKSVGEYVKEHHEYFSNNVNYNENDCCNLKLNIQKEDSEQVSIFDN